MLHDLSQGLLYGTLIGHIAINMTDLLTAATAAAEFKDLPLFRHKVLNSGKTYTRRTSCDKKCIHR